MTAHSDCVYSYLEDNNFALINGFFSMCSITQHQAVLQNTTTVCNAQFFQSCITLHEMLQGFAHVNTMFHFSFHTSVNTGINITEHQPV
jgi:hypothetical protein